ncbi:glycosyltransferase [Alteromonas sediminis]|uniref:Glycosyltransferase n=1 Tax=Alteromonas sediminis TaxID=2259342 RepID=A0A3N5YEP3_9ALTE|nr:glycosyltransferase family 2 protein [Alteromonas sediminis]RPJ68295.1 glycosyltransferase [Alteromonas sediminis]
MMRSLLRLLLLLFRKVLHSLPNSWRVALRHQHGLMTLYANALHSSRLFYGMLSDKQLQARYDKLIPTQTVKLTHLDASLSQELTANVLLVANLEQEVEESLRQLSQVDRVNKIFIISNGDISVPQHGNMAVQAVASIKDFSADNKPLIVIRSGECLHKHAVAGFLSYARPQDAKADIVTCDTDRLDEAGKRSQPECYPQWNPDLQLSTGYIRTGMCVFGEALQLCLIESLLSSQQVLSIASWLVEQYFDGAMNVAHCPVTLVHKATETEGNWFACLSKAASQHAWPIQVLPSKFNHNAVIQWHHDAQPLVSIIIPTRNGKDLVKTCIESILTKTTYPHYEILLIDNQSDDQEAVAYFAHLNTTQERVRLIPYPKPFNYSAINNFAVSHAKGQLFAFVNNDIEVISPDWLSHMVSHALRHDIGCVGAKLFYPNKRVQHAGVVMGYGGGAGHAHKFFPDYHPGYLNRLACTNAFSAVTAACLLLRKATFEQVGGFNESDLAVAFNDVDLCLKVAKLGLRNLYCAEAELFHYESISRGSENTPEKRARFEKELTYLQTTWQHYIDADPAYNPNLTLRRENFALKE